MNETQRAVACGRVVERVELPEWECDSSFPDRKKGRLSLADLTLWQSLVGHYFYFPEDPTGDLDSSIYEELWILGDVELDLVDLKSSQILFHRARGSSHIVQRAWCSWWHQDFYVVTEFSPEDKRDLLERLGFIPRGWKR